jgi:hypothetical protein
MTPTNSAKKENSDILRVYCLDGVQLLRFTLRLLHYEIRDEKCNVLKVIFRTARKQFSDEDSKILKLGFLSENILSILGGYICSFHKQRLQLL